MASASLNNYFFGPLSSQYCLIFYILCIYFLVVFILLITGFVFHVFSKKTTLFTIFAFLVAGVSHFAVYIGYRLLYNMCLNSTR